MPGFDRIARAYRWIEYLTFGRSLERCREVQIPRMSLAKRALVLGDGDGRFTTALLAHNRMVQVIAVDQSAAMLGLLSARAQAAGASDRLRTIQHDAVSVFTPASDGASSRLRHRHAPDEQTPGGQAFGEQVHGEEEPRSFDLVCSHFFLDCLSTPQVELLAQGVAEHLAPGALWIVSEFATPCWWAGLIVAILYRGFAVLAGLQTRQLPLWQEALGQNGFTCVAEAKSLAGLLTSSVWLAPNGPQNYL